MFRHTRERLEGSVDGRTDGSVTAVRPVRITGMASIPVLTLIVPR